MSIRNVLYNWGVFKVYDIPDKSICVGNLSMGGTGKTPHVAYLTKLLSDEQQISILSRGYGRTSKGLKPVETHNLAREVGDEPLFYKKRFGEKVQVVVSEDRKAGIQYIKESNPQSVILLDDAFQHRKVAAGLSILLTDFQEPYFKDLVVPAGRLREFQCGRKRADLVIVTKCPDNLDENVKLFYKKRLKFDKSSVYFSKIGYGDLVLFSQEKANLSEIESVLLVTGIANPHPLKEHLEKKYKLTLMNFPDHYQYLESDIQNIHKKFSTFAKSKKIIVTTEKDYMRFSEFQSSIDAENIPWFYQEIDINIDQEEKFNLEIKKYVRTI